MKHGILWYSYIIQINPLYRDHLSFSACGWQSLVINSHIEATLAFNVISTHSVIGKLVYIVVNECTCICLSCAVKVKFEISKYHFVNGHTVFQH